MKKISLVLIAMLLPCLTGNAQNKREPSRIVVLPFKDILGSSNASTLAFTEVLLSRLSREEKGVARLANASPMGQVMNECAERLVKRLREMSIEEK